MTCAGLAGTRGTSATALQRRTVGRRRAETARPRSRPRRQREDTSMQSDLRPQRAFALAIAALTLAGCTTFSPDGGFGDVEQIAKERLGKDVMWQRTDEDAVRARDDVQRLLAKDLSPDDAVQIALLNNPGLQAS